MSSIPVFDWRNTLMFRLARVTLFCYNVDNPYCLIVYVCVCVCVRRMAQRNLKPNAMFTEGTRMRSTTPLMRVTQTTV